jgi:hypothetical protein
MASGVYTNGIESVLNGGIDLDTTSLKVMLVASSYTYDPDHDFVDDITELSSVTNYTGGFNGAGRKAATVTITEQTANNRVVVILGDLTWTALGGASNGTIGGAALIREITNDAASIPIAFFDVTDTPTNGSDVTLDFDATNGNIRFTA